MEVAILALVVGAVIFDRWMVSNRSDWEWSSESIIYRYAAASVPPVDPLDSVAVELRAAEIEHLYWEMAQ
jgi:hypothetical protein